MSMLDARDATFRKQYPRGCHTYDAWGRHGFWPAPLRLVPIPPEVK